MSGIAGRFIDIIFPELQTYFYQENMDQASISERGTELFFRHMALILIANSDFRILLKVHCNGSDIKSLASKALEMTGTSDEGLPDFIKELANLLGGAIKRTLESSDISCGLSLPLLIKGFDELFSTQHPDSETAYFRIGKDGQNLVLQVRIEYLTGSGHEKLGALNIESGSSGSGDFEFL